jgi:hypothetical protein
VTRSNFRKALEWFRDSQSWKQQERYRGFLDARAERPAKNTSRSYERGYAAGSDQLPTAIVLSARRRDG